MGEPKPVGIYNSSITRVRPFFQRLLGRDPTGRLWLRSLLARATLNQELGSTLADVPGDEPLWMVDDKWEDPLLKQHFGVSVRYERCFERTLAPPSRLLEWLLVEPGRISPYDGWQKGFSPTTVQWREQLFGVHGHSAREDARKSALTALRKDGVAKSRRKWWAFEGFTEVDCLLENTKAVIAFEGKRTETQSSRVSWIAKRNQVIRNLEAVQQHAGSRGFAMMLLVEQNAGAEQQVVMDSLDDSLPHLSEDDRRGLIGHFLGCITWREACDATSPHSDWGSLPDTVCDVVAKWRERGR